MFRNIYETLSVFALLIVGIVLIMISIITISFVGTVLLQIFVPGMPDNIQLDGAESIIIQILVAMLLVYGLYRLASWLRGLFRKQ